MNPEYCATIVRLPELVSLAGCDNIMGARFFGLQAIVSKDSQPGSYGVLFTTETRLSEEFLSENNLYRHSHLNKDPSATGYFEDNGRVRAVKFRGHASNAFWMPLEALDCAQRGDYFTEGQQFDELNGHKICEKYIIVRKAGSNQPQAKPRRVSEKQFPQHLDTANFWRMYDGLDPFTQAVMTQKLHGTSVRIGRVLAAQELNWKQKLAKFFGVAVKEHEYELVAGSRRVTKDQKDDDGGFYASDIYTQSAIDVGPKIPQGYMVYGELIGWTPEGQPIQRGYTYQIPQGQLRLYVYRVSQVNPQGLETDLSWDQTKEFCTDAGLNHVPQLYTGKLGDLHGIAGDLMDMKLKAAYGPTFPELLPLEKSNPCDEGVCIRIDGLRPKVFKAKSPLFLEHETKLLDKGEADMEAVA